MRWIWVGANPLQPFALRTAPSASGQVTPGSDFLVCRDTPLDQAHQHVI
jgi:hypothetical protein